MLTQHHLPQDDPSIQAFILAALTAGGGITGYARTGSIPSIAAGVTVGALVRRLSSLRFPNPTCSVVTPSIHSNTRASVSTTGPLTDGMRVKTVRTRRSARSKPAALRLGTCARGFVYTGRIVVSQGGEDDEAVADWVECRGGIRAVQVRDAVAGTGVRGVKAGDEGGGSHGYAKRAANIERN
ncbi:MAG: hypothetical protein Q9207_001580 [Kuettlingeria erythrocarpa]